jgi:hypothetical protein
MTTLVFLHGWSVTSTSTYGQLPAALAARASAAGGTLRVVDIHLGEYVTFDDAVTMDDIVRAFDHALRQLGIADGRFDCVTHSTGGPVAMAWLLGQLRAPGRFAPLRLQHLMMLAPAHFGSALAMLGKGTVGKLKAWFDGIEPGQRILDWLQLGSPESLAQNLAIAHGTDLAPQGTYLFNLIGDRPDRHLYDVINSYTGEDGSDGVVRLAGANLNIVHGTLDATAPSPSLGLRTVRAPRTAFKLLPGLAHSGSAQGIMGSEPASAVTLDALMRCLSVDSAPAYASLCDAFDRENAARDADKVELRPQSIFPAQPHIHDPRSLLIFRLRDDYGEALTEAQFQLTAGPQASPMDLPSGFLIDRQANARSGATVAMFLNHALLAGDGAVPDPRHPGETLRRAVASRRPYGARLVPTSRSPLVRHVETATATGVDLLDVLGPHQTTVLDVVVPRHVAEGVFRFTSDLSPQAFKNPAPGPDVP